MKLQPPTEEEFEEWVRNDERNRAIPMRLGDIERWLRSLKEAIDPDEIRNTPDMRLSKSGTVHASRVTDLDAALEHVSAVRRIFAEGDFLLALSSLKSLEARVVEINKRVRRKGAIAKSTTARDIDWAKACRAEPGWPDDRKKIIDKICKGEKYDTAYRAVKRGEALLDSK